MSQHDFDITTADADTGTTVRAAINAALQALASNSSGSAYPAVRYANMMHVNTAGAYPMFVLRNMTNTLWLSMFTVTNSGLSFSEDIVVNQVRVGRGANSNNGNVLCGDQSMVGLTTGTYNSAFGSTVMNNLSSGIKNTAVGCQAGRLMATGNDNSFFGFNAGAAMTTGIRNVVIGTSAAQYTSALASITSATGCVYIGADVRPSATGNTNEIVIGDTAIGAGSNTATIGSSAITKTVLGGVIQKRALDTAPASATATGTTGEIRVTATHIYVCTATNTWVRTALATW